MGRAPATLLESLELLSFCSPSDVAQSCGQEAGQLRATFRSATPGGSSYPIMGSSCATSAGGSTIGGPSAPFLGPWGGTRRVEGGPRRRTTTGQLNHLHIGRLFAQLYEAHLLATGWDPLRAAG